MRAYMEGTYTVTSPALSHESVEFVMACPANNTLRLCVNRA